MRRLSAILLLVLALAACAPPVTTEQARATAVAGGCWPYGSLQPNTPTPATPRPGSPPPTPAATVVAYPECTPLPGTPTATIRPTATPRPTLPPTPPAAPPLSGMNEIGQPPGKNTDLRLAILSDGRAAVAWTNWGWAPPNSGDDGQVFVRVQEANGRWGIAQTVTRTPVNGGVGGVGIAVTISNTIVVAWGDGHGAVWASESTDVGENWSQPAQLGTFAYQVIALHGDTAGGLHLLALTPDPHRLRYLARPAGQTAWQTPVDVPLSGEHFGGDLAVLNLAGGGVRRFIVARLEGSVGLVRSDDGQSWTPIPVELGRYMAEPNPDKVSVMAASRPAGDLVAISWSQYSAGGVFTQISTDGGVSWGREERVAQHQHDGGCYAGAENTEGLPCGYYPSMAYDAASDSLAIGWVEVVRQREPPMRMLLSARRLSEQSGWRFVITPDQPDTPPVLAPWGWQGTLYGTAAGRYTWIVLIDTRNDQNRVGARQIELPAILGEVAS